MGENEGAAERQARQLVERAWPRQVRPSKGVKSRDQECLLLYRSEKKTKWNKITTHLRTATKEGGVGVKGNVFGCKISCPIRVWGRGGGGGVGVLCQDGSAIKCQSSASTSPPRKGSTWWEPAAAAGPAFFPSTSTSTSTSTSALPPRTPCAQADSSACSLSFRVK